MADGSEIAAKPAPAIGVTKPKPVKKVAPQRVASTITFPYRDLEVGISVAQAILTAGGVPLTSEQLAGVMNLQAGSGNFVVKVATARIFGLVTNNQGRYELTDLGFSIVDKDEKRWRGARAAAFLNVPLYKKVYEEFRGRQLPPRPHGLEQAFVKFGVSQKQKDAARLIFDKSAQQAGFFAAGPDRLIEPIITGGYPGTGFRPTIEGGETVPTQPSPQPAQSQTTSEYHPFIQGLLDTLPQAGTNWAMEGRAKWLQAAANCFDLIYKGSGEIHITAKAAHQHAEPANEIVTNKPRGPEPVRG